MNLPYFSLDPTSARYTIIRIRGFAPHHVPNTLNYTDWTDTVKFKICIIYMRCPILDLTKNLFKFSQFATALVSDGQLRRELTTSETQRIGISNKFSWTSVFGASENRSVRVGKVITDAKSVCGK